jgi:hypothetical protein
VGYAEGDRVGANVGIADGIDVGVNVGFVVGVDIGVIVLGRAVGDTLGVKLGI